MMTSRKLPIGISDFKKLIEQQYQYIDKSLFIQELLNRPAEVVLLPRPRRFGKTLNLSMLRYFFERTEESQAHLFRGLAIEHDAEAMAHQGQYPVIFFTFKDVKTTDFETCLRQIHEVVTKEYERQASSAIALHTPREEHQWQAILAGKADQTTLMNSLSLLMSLLRQRDGQRVIVLIDEYDAPIHAGYQYGYYDEIVIFMRNLLSAAFKDNTDLEKGILSGILRVAKESIFSGLNNLVVYSLLNLGFAEYFGFTPPEVERLLQDVGLTSCLPLIEQWYNGYLVGNQVLYNPWSVLNFLEKYPEDPAPYWINTSSNELIRDLLLEGQIDVQEPLEVLLAGGTPECVLNDNIVLRDIRSSSDTVLNLLTYSGYLKPIRRVGAVGAARYALGIPNQEVRMFYEDSVRLWLHRRIGSQRLDRLLQAFISGDMLTFGKILQDMVTAVLSYHDTAGDEPERVYHAFVLGLFVHLQDRYTIRSNRESGYGRYDVLLIPHNTNDAGFVLEFKKIDKDDDKTPQAALHSALQQIQDKQYAAELQAAGVRTRTGVGVVVDGKRVWVESIDL